MEAPIAAVRVVDDKHPMERGGYRLYEELDSLLCRIMESN